jgi:hypothetical protein
MSRHESSPIFSLSSPDPICPVVYAGTTGRVYELEISETDYNGNLVDPYFAATPGACLAKETQELAMYEMDDDDSGFHMPMLWVRPEGRRIRNFSLMGQSRIDSLWRWDLDDTNQANWNAPDPTSKNRKREFRWKMWEWWIDKRLTQIGGLGCVWAMFSLEDVIVRQLP